jgi:hypothetical protein
VTIDAGFLARVYHGPDPNGFAQLVGRMALDPNALVISIKPDSIGIAVLYPGALELGNVVVGQYLFGDWFLLNSQLKWSQKRGADCFLYPVTVGQPNSEQLGRILTNRYGFALHQQIYIRRFHEH